MRNTLRLLVAGVMAAIAPHAMADVIIGGLSVPTGPFSYTGSIFENVVTNAGDVRSGFGEVFQINGVSITSLCSGCELTYRFGGYSATSVGPTGITYSGGFVNFYLGFGADNDFDPYSSADSAADVLAATNGALFLTLKGHSVDPAGSTYVDRLFLNNGLGALDVDPTGAAFGNTAGPGAIANANFDTNAVNPLFGGFADFGLADSFGGDLLSLRATPSVTVGQLPHPGECPGGPACRVGTTTITGFAVPEPEMLSLWGLGLLAFGFSRRIGRKPTNRVGGRAGG